MGTKNAVIIGAGPAGLTAAHELLERTETTAVVLEMTGYVGGISRTVNYKGNRIDIGGHRFFSKSDRVMEWWLRKMPIQGSELESGTLTRQRRFRPAEGQVDGPDPDATDRVMLVRRRKSRIYFLRKFFDYPLRFSFDTVSKLGLVRISIIAFSYGWAALFGQKKPSNLEEFFVSRFGRELYQTFFKSYTEKIWGESCSNISAEWGEQRIKGLSIGKALLHFLGAGVKRSGGDIRQEDIETSLIEQFLYPKYGPGQMWEIVADEVRERGGAVTLKQQVTRLHVHEDRVTAVDAVDTETGRVQAYTCDYVFSTMPVMALIEALDTEIPDNVREVAAGLIHRDFITVGLLLKRLKVQEKFQDRYRPISDNWIYIQEPDVKIGRLQVFNNWSPYMVADPATTWIGLEYFCNDTDDLWTMADTDLIELAKAELSRIGIVDTDDVLDGTVIRMPKTYPAYFGTYERFGEIRDFLDRFSNLFLIGRNGMHRYNNQDHSMLTAMTAVDNIVAGRTKKDNIWAVNTEQEYHEGK